MIPSVMIDEDRQLLIVAVPYYPVFIQDMRARGLRGTFVKEKKCYEFPLASLPEVIACLNHNFPKVNQSPSIALSCLLAYLDDEDLLNVYRILAKKYRTGLMRTLLEKTFGPFIHIEREIIASKPSRRIELDDEIMRAEELADPSTSFAEVVRDLEESLQAGRRAGEIRAERESRRPSDWIREEPDSSRARRDPPRRRAPAPAVTSRPVVAEEENADTRDRRRMRDMFDDLTRRRR
jgi:hypothetical protein